MTRTVSTFPASWNWSLVYVSPRRSFVAIHFKFSYSAREYLIYHTKENRDSIKASSSFPLLSGFYYFSKAQSLLPITLQVDSALSEIDFLIGVMISWIFLISSIILFA